MKKPKRHKRRLPKRQKTFDNESYYRFDEDWDIINSDFRKFYNRSLVEVIQDKSIIWPEFEHMISNLGPESGLAYIATIRSEKDPVKIRKFTPSQRKIYLDWKKKHGKKEKFNKEMAIEKTNGFFNALREYSKQA